ncbi:MAG: preprotein translocase subunit SecG [Bacteroidales bacterium]|nr:preprotein translocase subunit SecG [Bacteroidales bacterium]
MNWLFVTLTVFILIACALLILVVLLQNGKGDGLASNFVAGNQTFGVRQTADMLEKVTWGLVSFVLVVSILSSFTLGRKADKGDITDKVEAVQNEAVDFGQATPIDVDTPTTEGEQSNN